MVRFVARFSAWKVALMQASLLFLAINPTRPGFSDDLLYTKWMFEGPFIIIPVLAIGGMFIMALLCIPLLRQATRGDPALEISDETISIFSLISRSISRSQVTSVDRPQPGMLRLQVQGDKPLLIPVFLYRNSAHAWKQLSALLVDGATEQSGAAPPAPSAHPCEGGEPN